MAKSNDNESYSGTSNLEAMASAKNYNRYLVELVSTKLAGAGFLLDFGAGLGTYALELREKHFSVACLEPDLKQSITLERLGLNNFRNINEVPDSSIEAVYSLNVLEHIENDSECMETLRRKMVTGGRILIYVPAFNSLFSNMDKHVGHYRRYNKKTLNQLFPRASWRILETEYVDSVGFFASIYLKLFGAKDGRLDPKTVNFYDRILFPISRIFDIVFRFRFGKNVWILAQKI